MSLFHRLTATLVAAALAVGPVSAATASAATTTQTVAQTTQAATAVIKGRITTASGNGLGGATITAQAGNNTYTTETLADGSFSLNAPPGLYTVTISHAGYQSAANDLALASGVATTINVSLKETTLSTLQVIASVSASANRAPFNVSESTVNVLPPEEFTIRENSNITDTVATLPGVIASRTFSATPNTDFAVRGAVSTSGFSQNTRVTVDGHAISSGTVGEWNTNYANPSVFQYVEVADSGINGSLAGESIVGTVNLRTRDFSPKNSFGLNMDYDQFGSGQYNVWGSLNFANNKASILVEKAFNSFNGPLAGYNGDIVNTTGLTAITPNSGTIPMPTGLEKFQLNMSSYYNLEAELAKFRYRFSPSTSVTLEYLGLQGQYLPQAGAYSTYYGQQTVDACRTGTTLVPLLANCTSQSLFSAPYTFGNIGNTVNAYGAFPNSFIQNNEPLFAAEFRTTWKNDTILLRPYTDSILRYISGASENQYPGNGGGWYPVTNIANCQVPYFAAGAAGSPATGGAGPCFSANMTANSPAYVGNDTTGHVFATTSVAPNGGTCSPTPPFTCFTTLSGIENDGKFGYSTPFSQPEFDKLFGYTAQWIHPLGNGGYLDFSYDYRIDFDYFLSGDTTLPAAGCQAVVGTATGSNVIVKNTTTLPSGQVLTAGQPYQPTCSSATAYSQSSAAAQFDIIPKSPISTPPTTTQFYDFALVASLPITDQLRLGIGNYFEIYKAQPQSENLALINAYAQAGNGGAAPVSLVTNASTVDHYDPHIGLEYRATPDLSLRANGGSSITQPYAGLLSGFGAVTIPNAAAHNYTNSIPNAFLKPEVTVGYDAGFDFRFGSGNVFSMDGYLDTVHNAFISLNTIFGTAAAPPPGLGSLCAAVCFPDTEFINTSQTNAGLERFYGVEATLRRQPAYGWGYYLTTSLARSFYYNLPLSLYSSSSLTFGSFTVPNAQIFGVPFAKGYYQASWTGLRGTLFELGADWEGQGNSTLGPPYVMFDSTIRVPVQKNVTLQMSIQNITNVNQFQGARNFDLQGNIEPEAYVVNNQIVQANGGTTSLQALPPRTVRLGLNINI